MAADGTVGTVQLCQTPTGNTALENKHELENTSLENSTPTWSFTALPHHLCPGLAAPFLSLPTGFTPVLSPRTC